MGIKSFYATVLSSILRKTEIGKRLDIALVAFHANLQFPIFAYAESGGTLFSEKEIDTMFSDLDAESRNIAKRFISRQYKTPVNGLMIHPKYFYSNDEKLEYHKVMKDMKKVFRQFHLPRNSAGPESLYYHHGLRFSHDFIKAHISGKLFGDIGGWIGDSTLALSKYSPAKTLIFEPDETQFQKIEKNLERNHISKDKYDLLPFALSDSCRTSNGMEFKTLDEICQNTSTPFGVLKADIEGMAVAFLHGAKKTIERDRPFLSIAIYHNEEEFTGVYNMLKEWDLGYHIEIKSLAPLTAHGEITLIAYPEEWIQKS